MATTAAVAGVLCLGLFVIQVTGAALRQEPGALGRALTGLVVSAFGSAAALACTRVLITAVDALCEGFVTATMGTNMQGIGQKLAFTQLNSITNPVVTVLLAVVLCSVVIVWAAMMIRKLMILIAAVLAPLAFAGATADITRAWVRRWIEFVAAMIVSKLLLVIIFSRSASSALNGAGSTGAGAGQDATQLAAGIADPAARRPRSVGSDPDVPLRRRRPARRTRHRQPATAGGRPWCPCPQKASRLYFQGRAAIGSPRPPAPSLRQGRPPARRSPAPTHRLRHQRPAAATRAPSSVGASPRGAGPLPHSAPVLGPLRTGDPSPHQRHGTPNRSYGRQPSHPRRGRP